MQRSAKSVVVRHDYRELAELLCMTAWSVRVLRKNKPIVLEAGRVFFFFVYFGRTSTGTCASGSQVL